jgi:argininosuccinate lyase
MMRLSRSEASYFRLAPYDVAGSRAHANELVRAGLITQDEGEQLHQALAALDRDVARGDVVPAETDEDVHTFLERVLTERLGPLGGKLRAGRSRNDQAANDLKLYLRDQARRVLAALCDLQEALIGQAEAHAETLAPGFTHLQPAQPIVFGHHLLAHAQSLSRDGERLQDWDRRAARSPLGAAALAGSAIGRHPEWAAREMGYAEPCENSIDAVAARDHVAEFLFIAAMTATDLSRLAEEVFIWTSRQFRFVELDDAYATGSSIMPQKKNPDIAELTRGRAARLIGDLTTMLVALKGLPLAYNRDLAEDKRAAFDAVDQLLLVLPAMAGMIRTMRVDAARLAREAVGGFTLATEVADWLARRGVAFAEAHEITGALVRLCEDRGIGLEDVPDDALASIDPRLTPDVRAALTPEAAVAARSCYGGTAPARVREQIGRLRAVVDGQRGWAAAYEGPRMGSHHS